MTEQQGSRRWGWSHGARLSARLRPEERRSRGKGVAMQMTQRPAIPSPWGPLVAKTDHSPEQSPRNGRCHSSLWAAVAVSQPGCQELGQGVRTSPRPLRTRSPPQGMERWLGPLPGAREAANWIGTLHKHISCLSRGKGVCIGGWGRCTRLPTVFVLGLSLALPAASP